MWTYVVLVACLGLTQAQYQVKSPDLALMKPGLRMKIPHEDGITLFAVHYSINEPVEGVNPGDYNYDINSPTGNEWVHENPDVPVVVGDTVYFWHYVLHEGIGYQMLDQSWLAVDNVTTTQAPTTTTTTATTTTGPPTTSGPSTTPGPTTSPNPTTTSPTDGSECTSFPCLIFDDAFDTFDFTKWDHEITAGGGGNWEFQYYINNRTNSYTKDGVLYLKPTLTEDRFGPGFVSSGTLELWGANPANLCTGNQWYGCSRVGTDTNYINPIQSARVRTVNSFNFAYGRVDIEAQVPKGDWLWPAIWMLPAHNEYGDWPASGEVDIMESRGNLDLTDETGQQQGNSHTSCAMHWGPYFEENMYTMTTGDSDGDFGDNFHKYSVEWNANTITYYVDDVERLVVDPGTSFWDYGGFDSRVDIDNPWEYGDKMAPFDKPFYLVMNVAVGGTGGFFPDGWTNANGPKPWVNTSPTAPKDFWLQKDTWYPTWNPTANNGEDAAMKIRSVQVWKMTQEDVGP